MVLNDTFNNILVIMWRQFYRWRKPEYPYKTKDLPQVTDKLRFIIDMQFDVFRRQVPDLKGYL